MFVGTSQTETRGPPLKPAPTTTRDVPAPARSPTASDSPPRYVGSNTSTDFKSVPSTELKTLTVLDPALRGTATMSGTPSPVTSATAVSTPPVKVGS